jgi:hypothetical protein
VLGILCTSLDALAGSGMKPKSVRILSLLRWVPQQSSTNRPKSGLDSGSRPQLGVGESTLAVHLIGGGCGQRVQEHGRCGHVLATPGVGRALPPLTADGRGHSLGPSLGCGEVNR